MYIMDEREHYTSEDRKYFFLVLFTVLENECNRMISFRNTAAYYLCNFKLYYLGSIYLCGSLLAPRDLNLFKV